MQENEAIKDLKDTINALKQQVAAIISLINQTVEGKDSENHTHQLMIANKAQEITPANKVQIEN